MRRLEEGSFSPKTPVRGNLQARQELLRTPTIRELFQTPDKSEDTDPRVKQNTPPLVPKLNAILDSWVKEILSLNIEDRRARIELDLNQDSSIHKLMKKEKLLNTCLFCDEKHARSFSNKRHMLKGSCAILRSALITSSDSDGEEVVGGAVEPPRNPSSQGSDEPVVDNRSDSVAAIIPPSYSLSKDWKAGDAIPETVLNKVLVGTQSKEIDAIRRDMLKYLAQPEVNSSVLPVLVVEKMQALEEALKSNATYSTEFKLTDEEKTQMESYIRANIVDNQVGRLKKKPKTVQTYATRLWTSKENGLLSFLKRNGIEWRFHDIIKSETIDLTSINEWIYQYKEKPQSEGQACAAVCSLLAWIGQELKNNGRREYGNDIIDQSAKFGQRVSVAQKAARKVSEVNKEIRETTDPQLLSRIARSMNEWTRGETMKKMKEDLNSHQKNKTFPAAAILSKWSIQLATCLALTNGARPQIGAMMVCGDLSTLEENLIVQSGRFYTIQLQKFNPFKTGTIISDIIMLIILISI